MPTRKRAEKERRAKDISAQLEIMAIHIERSNIERRPFSERTRSRWPECFVCGAPLTPFIGGTIGYKGRFAHTPTYGCMICNPVHILEILEPILLYSRGGPRPPWFKD